MKNSILGILILMVLAVACSKERETASGQKFTIVKKGDGVEIDPKKFMVMSLVFKDGKDSVWNDTRKGPFPWIFRKQGIKRPGDKVLEVISMLTKGDSSVFKVSVKDIFSQSFHQPIPPKVDSTSFFTFYVGVSDVFDSAQFIKYRDELVAKQNATMEKQKKDQFAADTVIIDKFLKEKNIVAMKSASGLRYVITKAGSGENGKDGQTAKVNYTGYLLDGKYFDTSNENIAKAKNLYHAQRQYGPIEVVLGRHGVIQGWEDALKLMNKGSKMTVYIPSTLAYGNNKSGPIVSENSILVFDMELVDLK